MAASSTSTSPRLTRHQRESMVLDSAAKLFYARGVHEVGMDELIGSTGLGKATVYRLFATKDLLIGAYLERLAGQILETIDAEGEARIDDPKAALMSVMDAIEADLGRPGFRGCAFNNASIEYDDPDHPARFQARHYRQALLERLMDLSARLCRGDKEVLAGQLAVIIDGVYTNAAHLGPDGPASEGLRLARQLIDTAGGGTA